jgi:hypothetical protein
VSEADFAGGDFRSDCVSGSETLLINRPYPAADAAASIEALGFSSAPAHPEL